MKKRNDAEIAYYQCRECSKLVTVPRQRGRRRENGHLKTMWCPFCNHTVDFFEMDKSY